MPLNFASSGSGGSPFIRFSVEDNEWLRSSEEGELETVDLATNPVIIDIERVRQGWLKLQGGRDWVQWLDNDYTKIPKPSDAHKEGASVDFYSTKLFGDEPVREFCSSQEGAKVFIKELYDACEEKFGSGQVPVIKLTGSNKVKMGRGNTRIPTFEVVGWKERPDDLNVGVPGTTIDTSSKSASTSAPVAEAESGSTGDINFDEI